MLQTNRSAWCRIALTGAMTVTMLSTAMAQNPRVSSRETYRQAGGDVLDSIDRTAPRYDLNPQDPQRPLTDIDVSKVDPKPVLNLMKEGLAEAGRLYTSLQQDIRNNTPELRTVAGDVDKLRAWTSYIVEDLQRGRPLAQVLPAIQQLDTEWRYLSHQLGQSPRISNASLDIVDRIDRIGSQVSRIFRLDPQLDRQKLLSEFAYLETSISRLADELEIDERNRNVDNRDLIYDCRNASQQARRVSDMLVGNVSYERLVDEYQRFNSRWSDVDKRLARFEDRRIRRDLRDIADIDDRIHDLLWIEKSADPKQLQKTAQALIDDVDEYFNRTPLKLLLHIKNAGPVLKTADDFYASVRHFEDCINQNKSNQELLECYRDVELDGDAFVRAFQPLKSNTAAVVLREIDDGIHSLRAELNISGSMTSIDTRELAMHAAKMESLAADLSYDVSRWLQRERPNYSSDAQRAMDRLIRTSRDMQVLIQRRPSIDDLRRGNGELQTAWRDLHQYLGRCRTSERQHMVYTAQDITQVLFELQAPLDMLASR